jgi:hypothetical protein
VSPKKESGRIEWSFGRERGCGFEVLYHLVEYNIDLSANAPTPSLLSNIGP